MKRFYAALLADEEYEDGVAWAEWQRAHPADLAAASRGVAAGGGGGMSPGGGAASQRGGGVCFK